MVYNKHNTTYVESQIDCFTLPTDLWTWEQTHRGCRGWAPACETSDHLRRRQAQWGTRTREGFLPPAQAVDAAAALAPAELFPFPVHGLPRPPTPLSTVKTYSCWIMKDIYTRGTDMPFIYIHWPADSFQLYFMRKYWMLFRLCIQKLLFLVTLHQDKHTKFTVYNVLSPTKQPTLDFWLPILIFESLIKIKSKISILANNEKLMHTLFQNHLKYIFGILVL